MRTIVVFDPQTISHRSTYPHPMEPSVGVRYLPVDRVVVVDQGTLAANAHPGRPVKGTKQ
jgi:hypothetical protein